MAPQIQIGNRGIGPGNPSFVIAEMSANHGQSFDQAVAIVRAAKDAGADAVKLQTYTPDTMTISCEGPEFQIKGTLWKGRSLYELYREAYTPWEWQPRLRAVALELGMELFSSPFDSSAIDFLESMNVPAYKLASFELVDMPLIQRMAETGKPLIMSTGMATLEEIDEAMETAQRAGAKQIALLKCTSAYPAPIEQMNLRTIPELSERFGVPVGLSDHSLGTAVPVAAVVLGACIVEKHITLSRANPGPDSAFSLEPNEFKATVNAIRVAEKALGSIHFGFSSDEQSSRVFRRSLFIVEDMKCGDIFSDENVRAIRPGHGLHTRYLPEILGRRASCDIARGTPLKWEMVEKR